MNIGIDITTGERIYPIKGSSAICQCCSEYLIAKCGQIRINHWAHKNKESCDKWWENETQWHRNWKNEFPKDWQEIIKTDLSSGEKHIADIFNPNKNLVIEFQNSPISVDEILSRENFYNKMIWVINAHNFKIELSPLKSLEEEFELIENKFYGGMINNHIKFPDDIKKKLFKKVDECVNSSGHLIDNSKITELMILFNSELDKITSSHVMGEPIYGIHEPNNLKAELLEKMVFDGLKQIGTFHRKNEKLNESEKFYRYKLKSKRKAWDFSNSNIFLDVGDELYLLKSDFVLKKVPIKSFIKHYNQ